MSRIIAMLPECNTPRYLRRSASQTTHLANRTRTHPHTASADTRHSGLTHLGEQGVSLLLFMVKSRHKSVSAARKYFKTGAAALAEVTSLLASGDSQH